MPLEIEPGDSLLVRIDGEILKLRTREGSVGFRSILRDGSHSEIAGFDLTIDELRRIAHAKTGEIRLRGARMHVDATLTADNLKKFRQFVDMVEPVTPSESGEAGR
jgi:hypothetical protein